MFTEARALPRLPVLFAVVVVLAAAAAALLSVPRATFESARPAPVDSLPAGATTWVVSARDLPDVLPPRATPWPAERGVRNRADERRFDGRTPAAPWTALALRMVARHGLNPPRAGRTLALVSVAMNDALVTAEARRASFRDEPPMTLVAGAAANAVLLKIFPPRPELITRPERRAIAAQIAAGATSPRDASTAVALGRVVGARVMARAKADGASASWSGPIPDREGGWVPVPPKYTSKPPPGVRTLNSVHGGAPEPADRPQTRLPTQPLAGRWRTWNLRSGRQFRPGPPARPGSAAFAAELRDVYKVSRSLTPRQKLIATSWAAGPSTSTPAGLWTDISLGLMRSEGVRGRRQAEIVAALNTAQADAVIASWDAKYAYWSIRPFTAVRQKLDRGWKPLLNTPQFPSYVSGHATISAAAAEVLAHYFPRRAGRLRAMAREAAMSRLYGGIHFRSDNEVGAQLGRRVGRAAVERVRSAG